MLRASYHAAILDQAAPITVHGPALIAASRAGDTITPMASPSTTQPAARPVILSAPYVNVRRVLAAVLLLLLVLRLPSLWEPQHYGDEGVFAATASAWASGDTLYTETWDNKPPLVFAVYRAVIAVSGPAVPALRIVGLLFAAGTAVAVVGLSARIGGRGAPWVAGVCFALLAALPLTESTLLLSEAMMALPAALGMLVAVTAVSGQAAKLPLLVLSGLLFGIAGLFKQVAVFDLSACLLWLLLLRPRAPYLLLLPAAGAALPPFLVGLWLWQTSALGEAWGALVGGYDSYLGEANAALNFLLTLLRLLPLLLALGISVSAAVTRRLDVRHLAALWFGFALLGVTLSGRPYGHYLWQAFAPAALLLSAAVAVLAVELAVLLAAGVVLALNVFAPFWLSHPTVRPAYWTAWFERVSGNRSAEEYDHFFNWRVPNQEALAERIRQVEGERTLFIWGEYPWLYAMLEADNPARYATSYQTMIHEGAKQETIARLRAQPPRFIVEEVDEWRRLPGLRELLDERYEPVEQIDNARLWLRRDGG